MFVDLDQLDGDALVRADVCIVGAGAAGISLAREFLGGDLSVVLVESGGLELETETQALYRGEAAGFAHTGLDTCRMRYFGGSTNCWNGWCVPLDELDFEPRDWVPHSGWPIRKADLDPYYVRAHEVVGIGDYKYGDGVWKDLGLPAPAFDARRVRSWFWQYSRNLRFGSVYRDAFAASSNVRVLTHANAVNVRLKPSGKAVDEIELQSLSGKRGRVAARHFVMACGGIENARLLLASNDVERAGVGNRRDVVGRYFMEHPYTISGVALTRGGPILPSAEKVLGGVKYDLGLLAGVEAQEKHRVLNCGVILDPSQDASEYFIHDLAWPEVPAGYERSYLMSQSEQTPKPESRVLLSEKRDTLGHPQARLDWKVDELDKRSIEVMTRLVGTEFARLGFGRVQLAKWMVYPDAYWGIGAGNHHMGTTRMGDDPGRSVVDAHCQVHGVENLHIAGSSVFSTAGHANPTLTLIALALRLGDRIQQRLRA